MQMQYFKKKLGSSVVRTSLDAVHNFVLKDAVTRQILCNLRQMSYNLREIQ